MILYHFPTSPFARRVRLTLAHKGLSAELRDARANPEHLAEVRRLNPTRTVPVLVDGDRVLTDSTSICRYLDAKVPDPVLFTNDVESFEIVALADHVGTVLPDLGLRYSALHDHPSFADVRAEAMGRVQNALERLTARILARKEGWAFAEIATFTLVAWLEGLPARAAVFPPAKQVLDLGWSVPPQLSAWAGRHRTREDVIALG